MNPCLWRPLQAVETAKCFLHVFLEQVHQKVLGTLTMEEMTNEQPGGGTKRDREVWWFHGGEGVESAH